MRRPGDDVDGGSVERETGNELPSWGRARCMRGGGRSLAPNFYGAVVGGGREDCTVLGVSLVLDVLGKIALENGK